MARSHWRVSAALLAASFLISTPVAAQLGQAVPVQTQAPPVVVVPSDPNNRNGPAVVQPVQPRPAVVLPAPAGGATARPPSGHFEIRALQFVVLNQTRDNLSEADGPGDEIRVQGDSFEIGRDGAITSAVQRRSAIFGSAGHADIVAGGALPAFSASSDFGGFKTGDSYGGRPRSSLAGDLPLVLWNGVLQGGQNAVVIVPSIWEMDDRSVSDAERAWDTLLAQALGPSSNLAPLVRASAPRRPVSTDLVGLISVFDDGNRPIGAIRHSEVVIPSPWTPLPHVASGMRPVSIPLSLAQATLIASTPASSTPLTRRDGRVIMDNFPIPQGGILVTFRDPPGNDGEYALVLQVVQLP